MDYKLNTETTQKWKTSNKMIQYTIHLILPLLLFMFSACNLNKMYLQPTEMKPDAKSATLYLEGDTVTINYRSEEHTSELQSRPHLVCRLLLEKKKHKKKT